jgi:hypothetical protein
MDITCFKQFLLNYLEMWYFKRPTTCANLVVTIIVVNMNGKVKLSTKTTMSYVEII